MKQQKWIIYFLITFICFKFIYGLSIINPTNINWLMSAYHDWGQHYLGWAFFREEDWTFPIGTIQNYNYPAGSNIGFTDSIPLLAVFFKIFTGILPNDFQYFGLWFLASHLLLTFYTVKFLKLFKVSDLLIYGLVILVSLNPVILYRGMHPALCAQWIIVACFYYYFKNDANKSLVNQTILLLLSATIHPYLLVMVAAFNIITPIKYFLIQKEISIKKFIFYITVPFISVILIWFFIGMIRIENNTTLEVQNSYGLFSTNLNAFINAQGFSKFLPQFTFYKVNQYEGFSYLGVGFIILLIITLFGNLLFKKIRANINFNIENVLFLLTTILLAFFAITNVVTFNENVLVEIPLPEKVIKIGNIFRASGRFIWPLYYTIFFATIIYFSKLKVNKYVQLSVLALTLIIQIYDISPMLFRYKETGTYVSKKINQQDWIQLTKSFKKIITFPPYENNLKNSLDYQDLCFVALKNNLPITCGYVARDIGSTNNEFKKQLQQQLNEATFNKKNLFITTEKYLDSFYPIINTGNITVKKINDYYFLYSNQVKINESLHFQDITKEIFEKANQELKININKNLIFEKEIIKYNFDEKLKSDKALNLQGWCFLNDKDIKVDSIKVGLTNQDNSYFSNTKIVERPDIVSTFGNNNLLQSGFRTVLFLNQLPYANYNIVIGIKDKNGWKYQKLEDEVEIKKEVKPQTINSIPKEQGAIIGNIDDFRIDGNKLIINGWAAIENKSCDNLKYELILFNNQNKYLLETERVLRRDVSIFHKVSELYNKSGYSIQINKGYIKKGKYKIALKIIENNNLIVFKLIAENKIIN